MLFNRSRLGFEALSPEDKDYTGSRYADVRAALFANTYYLTWAGSEEPPLPTYGVRLRYALAGLLSRYKGWRFQQASDRSIDARSDLRWGADRLGFRRILHPNGVGLCGTWEIDDHPGATQYTGYFAPGSRALVIGRYSVCCTETRSGHSRSLSLVGKVYPTLDEHHAAPLRPASFITQEDLGGSTSHAISDVELRNAPDVTPWKRGLGVGVFLLTGFVLSRTDKQNAVRQVYEIAELGKPPDQPTQAPRFMRLLAEEASTKPDPNVDFRNEILGRLYDPGDPTPRRTLTFTIEVSETGYRSGLLLRRWHIGDWKKMGRIVFHEAAASYNTDFVLHFPHPAWRDDVNDKSTVSRRRPRP